MEEVISWEGREEEANRKLQFPNLKKLEIGGKSLISFCKGANEIEFHQLEVMKLMSLPAVKTFFPPKVLFPKLVRMGFHNLKNMKEIVDGPLESGSLVKLKKLKIVDCESMEEVIKWEGREDDATNKLQFPKLRELKIQRSGVICFCRGAKEIEFHQLHRLELSNIRGVEFLISSSNENNLKSMFPHKVLFPKLVSMYLYELTNMKEIVDGPLEAGSFVKLKELRVSNCNQLRNIFRLPTETDTVHIEKLEIVDCESMEEVIKWEGREEDATTKLHFPKLREIFIQRSGVICFCRGAKEIEFHQLSYLKLSNLPGVECVISSSNENTLKSIFPHKVLFPRLEEMLLESMPNMKEMWCGRSPAGSFYNLAKLLISNCDSLEYVFSPYMAGYLLHLHTLHIDNCQSLKEVVATENDKDVEEYSSSILPKLQIVRLNYLPALGRFCHIANDLEFPVLDNVIVIDCPEFKTFAPGYVHTPKLNQVMLDYGSSNTLWKGNLNNTIQHLYEERSTTTYKQEDEKEDANENEIKEDS